MKFSINKAELQDVISVVIKGVATRTSLPILSGIYIDAQGDEIILQATNSDLSIQYAAAALVEEPGQAVLPGKLFNEIIKSLPDAAVHISANEEKAEIFCDAASFSIKALNPQDFPRFPHVDIQQYIDVPFNQFSDMIRRVARFVSRDESRMVLTGVLLNAEDETLKMVATDSYRLAVATAPIAQVSEPFQAVINGSFLQDIANLQKTDDPIRVALAENQLVFTYQNTIFINRRIEGNYPNYQQLIPSGYSTQVEVNTEQLLAAVKRTSLLGSSSTAVKVDIDIDGRLIQLNTASQDVGSVQENIDCEGTGENITIAFNCGYMIDGLSSIKTKTVLIETQDARKPGILKDTESDDFLYLLMPVRI